MNDAQVASDRVVTRGLIGEFGVVAVLQALSLSRQYTAVELFDEDGSLAGRVHLKSGMVLGAFVPQGPLHGGEAFRDIVSRSPRSFQVERLEAPVEYPPPIGRLSAQLLAARVASQRPPPPSAPPPAEREESLRTGAAAGGHGFSPRVVASPPSEPTHLRQSDAPKVVSAMSRPLSAVRNPAPVDRFKSDRPSAGPGSNSVPVVAVASPKGGSGKTTLSLNVSVSLAQAGLRVVLVDADPNGDVLSAISARERATMGLFDAVAGEVDASQLLLNTAIANMKVVPSMGPVVPHGLADRLADATMTRLVFEGLRGGADIVVVDTPAGMFGMSAQVLEVSTHVLGVLQAESIAKRSFTMFERGLKALADPPEVLGVVLNMFQRSHRASLSVLLDAGIDMPESWLFQTTIPRNDVFLDASEAGRPVRFADSDAGPVVSLLFDTLASEVRERLQLVQAEAPTLEGSFLV